jgi:hypothetical protein
MMSELEKRIAREIFGDDETRRTMETSSRRRLRVSRRWRAYAVLATFIFLLSLCIGSGLWVLTTPIDYLAIHLSILNLAAAVTTYSNIALLAPPFLTSFLLDSDDSFEELIAGIVTSFSLLSAALLGILVTLPVYGLSSALVTGLHHPFSSGGMSITSISSLIGLPLNAALSSSNSTQSLYLVELGIVINGEPINATLVVRSAVFSNPFNSIICVFYNSNVGAQSLPMVVHTTPSLVKALLSSSNNGYPVIKLSFLCNGIPTKAVLVTNYGNFTYLLVS